MLQESHALCGHMIKPPKLKIRSTGADEARTHKAWFASLKRAELQIFYSKNQKYLKATQSLLKLFPSIFLAVPLVLDLCYWVVSRLFIYFAKMFGTSGGKESPTVSAENKVLQRN